MEEVPSPKVQLQIPVAFVPFVKFTHCGAHPEVMRGLTEITGSGLTVTFVESVFIHPFASVPVTV